MAGESLSFQPTPPNKILSEIYSSSKQTRGQITSDRILLWPDPWCLGVFRRYATFIQNALQAISHAISRVFGHANVQTWAGIPICFRKELVHTIRFINPRPNEIITKRFRSCCCLGQCQAVGIELLSASPVAKPDSSQIRRRRELHWRVLITRRL